MNARRGLLLVVSSPSGAGKTSLTRRLIRDNDRIALSVSATTRPPRPGELHGREYHFARAEDFDRLVGEGAFLEWAEVHEHRYGTLRRPVEEALAQGRDILFDIDWQGAAAIAATFPADTVRVFILPPSMAELARRLHTRAQDSEAVIGRRLARAKGEIARWTDYDYVIVNVDFDAAYAELAEIYHAERRRAPRNPWLDGFVSRLMDESV
jgi:guanylate kinase